MKFSSSSDSPFYFDLASLSIHFWIHNFEYRMIQFNRHFFHSYIEYYFILCKAVIHRKLWTKNILIKWGCLNRLTHYIFPILHFHHKLKSHDLYKKAPKDLVARILASRVIYEDCTECILNNQECSTCWPYLIIWYSSSSVSTISGRTWFIFGRGELINKSFEIGV